MSAKLAHASLIWLTQKGVELDEALFSQTIERIENLFPVLRLDEQELPKALWGRIAADSLVRGVGRLSRTQRFALNVLPVEFEPVSTPKELAQLIQRESARQKARVGEFLRFLAYEAGIRVFHGSEYESLKLIKYGCRLTGRLGQDQRKNGSLDRRAKLVRLFDFAANFRHILYIGSGTGDSIRRAPKRFGYFDILYNRKRKKLFRKLVTFDGCECHVDDRGFTHIHHRQYITRENFEVLIRKNFSDEELRETCFLWDVRASGVKREEEIWERQTGEEDALGRLIAHAFPFKFFLVKFRIPRSKTSHAKGYDPMFFCNEDGYYEAFLAPGNMYLQEIVDRYGELKAASFQQYNEAILIEDHTYNWGDEGVFINGASLLGTPPEAKGAYTLRIDDPNGFGDRISTLDEIFSLQLQGFPAKSAKLLAIQHEAYEIHPSEASRIVMCGIRYERTEIPHLSVSTMIGLRFTSFISRFRDNRIHKLMDEVKRNGIDVSGHLTFLVLGNLEAVDILEWMNVVLTWGNRSVDERKAIIARIERIETNPEKDFAVWHRPADFVAAIHILNRCGYLSDRVSAKLVHWLKERWGAGRMLSCK